MANTGSSGRAGVDAAVPYAVPPQATDDRVRFAFWSYDLFPFVLGAKGEFTPDGDFRAYSYGSTFKREYIIDVMPVERGEKVHAALEKLRTKHRRENDELMRRHLDEAHAILPALKSWRKEQGRKP